MFYVVILDILKISFFMLGFPTWIMNNSKKLTEGATRSKLGTNLGKHWFICFSVIKIQVSEFSSH